MTSGTYDRLDADFVASFAGEWMEAYNAQALPRILALCSPEIRWEDPGLPEVGVGHDAVRRFLEMTWRAFPDIRFSEPEAPHLALDGSQAITRWAATATMRGPLVPPGLGPTGRRVAFDGVDLWRFRGGLLASYRAIYDTGNVGRQLGALPERGSLAERLVVALQRAQAVAMRRRR
jgi:predicted ester cyclase